MRAPLATGPMLRTSTEALRRDTSPPSHNDDVGCEVCHYLLEYRHDVVRMHLMWQLPLNRLASLSRTMQAVALWARAVPSRAGDLMDPRGGQAAVGEKGDRWQVAQALRRGPSPRVYWTTTFPDRKATDNAQRASRGGDRRDPRRQARRHNALLCWVYQLPLSLCSFLGRIIATFCFGFFRLSFRSSLVSLCLCTLFIMACICWIRGWVWSDLHFNVIASCSSNHASLSCRRAERSYDRRAG